MSGFEGLTISSDGKTLYALLQSGTVQDDESQYTPEEHREYYEFAQGGE